MRATRNVLSLIASLLLLGCGVVGEVGNASYEEDPALGHTDPVPEAVNPTAHTYSSFTSAACGTVLASWDGEAAYSNGPSTGTGYSCAGYGSYGLQYQCVELVMRYFKKKWGLRWHGNAKTLLAGAPRDKVDVYYNGDAAHPPVPGDMIVWTNSTYGHVALVTKVSSAGVTIMEQNTKSGAVATLPWSGNGHIGARWGSWVPKGWAHARANTAGGTPPPPPPPPKQPPPPPPKSCHPGAVHNFSYCSAGCPCDAGQGDCDSDAECKPGLICRRDVGVKYGAPKYVDVCEKPAAPQPPAPPKQPPPPPPSGGSISATCPGCNLATHDCQGYKGSFTCVPKPADSSCNYTDGYLFRQCGCTGWQFCLPSGQWAGGCAQMPSIFSCQ